MRDADRFLQFLDLSNNRFGRADDQEAIEQIVRIRFLRCLDRNRMARPDRPSETTRPEANTRAPDASGAPVPETTGQGPNFEDRWSGQPAIQYLPPAAISNVTTLETTGYAPTVSKKMGPEMESAGDVRGAPDSE